MYSNFFLTINIFELLKYSKLNEMNRKKTS
jgi:hypothetical protein